MIFREAFNRGLENCIEFGFDSYGNKIQVPVHVHRLQFYQTKHLHGKYKFLKVFYDLLCDVYTYY